MPKYACKVDGNQAEIVKALERAGASVYSLAAVGHGVPDLLVGFRGSNHLLEVKRNKKAAYTDDQIKFRAIWRGQYERVNTVDEALAAIGVFTPEGAAELAAKHI